MNWGPLLLLALFTSPPARTPPASILGIWRLKAVHVIVQRPDGTPPYGLNPSITLGALTETFTKDGRWSQLRNGNSWTSGTYQLRKGRLLFEGSEGKSRYQVRVLTATQLVTVIEKTEVDGLHAQSIQTFVR